MMVSSAVSGAAGAGSEAVAGPAQFAAQPAPRLAKAAHEFEGQLMKELLKPMVRGTAMEEDSDEGSAGVLVDFAGEALGQALSVRGGLGIADSILRNLSRNETELRPASDPGSETVEDSLSPRGRLK